MDIQEVKYNDLNNIKKLKRVGDVQRAAHSQGYNISNPKQSVGDHYTVDLTHRKSGDNVRPRSGGKLGGSDRGGGVDSTLVNQSAGTIKNDAESRGRVNKTDMATKKRRDQMNADSSSKREKQKARPFGGKSERNGGPDAAPAVRSAPKADPNSQSTKRRKRTGWKTFEAFMTNCDSVLTENRF